MVDLKQINTETELAELLRSSGDTPVFIFKHSTRCGTSAAVYGEVQRYLAGPAPDDKSRWALVRVIEERPIAQAIAAQLGVVHQSPQLILVRDGKPMWHASHHAITGAKIHEVVAGLQ